MTSTNITQGNVSLKSLRKNYKVVNYSATYGVGAPKLARETGMSVKEAKTLLEAFWSRNWSVTKVADSLTHQRIIWQHVGPESSV